jgi:hypothetical protein
MAYRLVPMSLEDANRLVGDLHRHHKPVQGHKFSLGALKEDGLTFAGAVIVGRPVARRVDHKSVLEVTRLVTDGSKNACSFLYGAAARAAQALGYDKIQTYILESENGVSLKASGWVCEGEAGGGQWKHTDGKPRRTDQPIERKQRWVKVLR